MADELRQMSEEEIAELEEAFRTIEVARNPGVHHHNMVVHNHMVLHIEIYSFEDDPDLWTVCLDGRDIFNFESRAELDRLAVLLADSMAVAARYAVAEASSARPV